jgi:fructose-1-phosphate kinase PfkB-like protein
LLSLAVPAVTLANPLGAGDTAAAVMLLEILAGSPPEKAFASALAAASASCETPRCAEFNPARARRLAREIIITKEQ